MAIFTSFDAFILSTDGTTVGAGECWGYINLIWSHLNSRYYTYPPLHPDQTNHGVKWGVLNSDARIANTITGLTYINDPTKLKRGDIVVSTDGEFGHAGFINQNYDPNRTSYDFYTQNYAGRRSVALDTYTLRDFGGAFRYNAWNVNPPVPSYGGFRSKRKFPFVLYTRKLNRKRQGL